MVSEKDSKNTISKENKEQEPADDKAKLRVSSRRSSTVEQSLRKGKVGGSIPLAGSEKRIENSELKTKNKGSEEGEVEVKKLKLSADESESGDEYNADMARRRSRSRLQKKESKRLLRQSLLYFVLTVALILMLIFWGVPSLIKFAGFLGDVRNTGKNPSVFGDDIAPFAPQMSLSYEATPSAKININGFAEAEATVTLFNGGDQVAELIVDEDGEFEFSGVELDAGENRLSAVAVDPAGNESEKSRVLTVIYDSKPPELAITSPTDGQAFYDLITKIITVEGVSEPDAEVFVNGNLALLSSDGSFSQRLAVDNGDIKIVVEAIDQAGNRSSEEVQIKVED